VPHDEVDHVAVHCLQVSRHDIEVLDVVPEATVAPGSRRLEVASEVAPLAGNQWATPHSHTGSRTGMNLAGGAGRGAVETGNPCVWVRILFFGQCWV
jgi:hypothetical protein